MNQKRNSKENQETGEVGHHCRSHFKSPGIKTPLKILVVATKQDGWNCQTQPEEPGHGNCIRHRFKCKIPRCLVWTTKCTVTFYSYKGQRNSRDSYCETCKSVASQPLTKVAFLAAARMRAGKINKVDCPGRLY